MYYLSQFIKKLSKISITFDSSKIFILSFKIGTSCPIWDIITKQKINFIVLVIQKLKSPMEPEFKSCYVIVNHLCYFYQLFGFLQPWKFKRATSHSGQFSYKKQTQPVFTESVYKLQCLYVVCLIFVWFFLSPCVTFYWRGKKTSSQRGTSLNCHEYFFI